MGSGTTALAALALKRHFIGFDISEEYVRLAKERIKEDFAAYQKKVEEWTAKKKPQLTLFPKTQKEKRKKAYAKLS